MPIRQRNIGPIYWQTDISVGLYNEALAINIHSINYSSLRWPSIRHQKIPMCKNLVMWHKKSVTLHYFGSNCSIKKLVSFIFVICLALCHPATCLCLVPLWRVLWRLLAWLTSLSGRASCTNYLSTRLGLSSRQVKITWSAVFSHSALPVRYHFFLGDLKQPISVCRRIRRVYCL